MTLKFITGNEGKFKEAKSILGSLKQLNIDLPEIQGIDSKKVIRAKLKEALKHDDGPFIIEDTSLTLDCLNQLPGPLIKWFLKVLGLNGVYTLTEKYDNHNATAKVIIGYLEKGEEVKYFEGVIKGSIVPPKGEGFGWDAVFKPRGSDKTFGEMTSVEKNNLSMRRKALDKLKKFCLEGSG